MATKGVKGLTPDGLIVTTGSQQALDLVAKTLINPNDVVLVEGPTFLATIQCFRLYGPQVKGVPIDADGVKVDQLEEMMVKHKPKLVYLIPTVWQSQWCADESCASPEGAGTGGEVPNGSGRRRSLWRFVFW
jgi:selenocysteine lyase/cysteine desulfurase